MDALDIRIFRELVQDSYGSPYQSDIRKTIRTVARRIQVDEDTVRNRIKKLEQTGFLKGWIVQVSPRLLGLGLARLWFDVYEEDSSPAVKDELIEKIRRIPNVIGIVNHLGSSMIVMVYYESSREVKKLVQLLSRMPDVQNIIRNDSSYPECAIPLYSADLRIIRSILHDPRRSYSLISRGAHLSIRTVKRRLARLIEGKALFLIPVMNMNSLTGSVMADLIVSWADQESRARVQRRISEGLDEYLIRIEINDEWGTFNLILPNVSLSHSILKWVKSSEGVKTAKIALIQEFALWYETQRDLIERRLEKANLSYDFPEPARVQTKQEQTA